MKKRIDIPVVPAADSHIPEVVEIWKEFMDFHSDIDPFLERRDDGHEHFENYLRERIDSDDAAVLVALDEDRVIGYSIVFISNHPPVLKTERYGFIDSLAVRSTYRRRGVGTAILKKMHEWFDSRGIDRIQLNVLPGNEIGNSFWRKSGFRDFTHTLCMDKK
ncbi:MAG: GNAT family N-acetyltransferase [Deltaproteobacteria bacterium]|uniref:GNAT family N-acetyltransferase n=1 Tax=Candidatus Zymogenus saltonus TaxID=2844893 RepID=A0A9D8KD70_9DELT|nr:GNAT family N-acetyltransferase [Candidatus Zymogenus saltonus]